MDDERMQSQRGFTLVEVMVTMAIALIIMAGMAGLFVSQTRTAQVLNNKSEVLNDLFLASQIMQFELRGAKAICWDKTKKLIRYQPLSSNDNLDTGCAKVDKVAHGYFQRKNKSKTHTTPYIFWNRIGKNKSEELIRGMKKSAAITISPEVNSSVNEERTITLTAQYVDKEKNMRDLSLSFKVWPRNTQ